MTRHDDPAVAAAKADPLFEALKWNCFCGIPQAEGDALTACQNDAIEPVLDAQGKPVDAWCYVDATTAPPLGNPAIVENCPAAERRIMRFVGAAKAANGATLFIACDDAN